MRTRIKIVEKNSGDKEYICQKFEPDYDKIIYIFAILLASIVGAAKISYAFLILSALMILLLWLWLSMVWTRWAICDTLEEAKERIDESIAKEKAEEEKEFAQKTKKVTYLKYP